MTRQIERKVTAKRPVTFNPSELDICTHLLHAHRLQLSSWSSVMLSKFGYLGEFEILQLLSLSCYSCRGSGYASGIQMHALSRVNYCWILQVDFPGAKFKIRIWAILKFISFPRGRTRFCNSTQFYFLSILNKVGIKFIFGFGRNSDMNMDKSL